MKARPGRQRGGTRSVPQAPPLPAALTPAAMQRRLRTASLGQRIHYYTSIGSTNERALELASEGAPEGSLVLAERQTRGRGRRDRFWHSPPSVGIYASLILRPGIESARAPLFTLMASLVVASGLAKACRLEARIKWPNDVVVRGRKIAGILGEARGAEARLSDMVVGIGVNVNHRSEDFPRELHGRPTSVRIETGAPFDRCELLSEILEIFERQYAALLRDGPADLLRAWRGLTSMPPGTRVRLEAGHEPVEGTLQDIDDDGALLLREDAGSTRRVPFGEIVVPL